MRVNKVKRVLEQGGVAMGTMILEFSTTGIGRITAEAGSEFVVYDMEHTGWSMETIRMLMASSSAVDLAPMVRVPTLQYHFISRILDVGAMGVVVPFVSNEEQAREIVACAKYPPEGRRVWHLVSLMTATAQATWSRRCAGPMKKLCSLLRLRMPTELNTQTDCGGSRNRRALDWTVRPLDFTRDPRPARIIASFRKQLRKWSRRAERMAKSPCWEPPTQSHLLADQPTDSTCSSI